MKPAVRWAAAAAWWVAAAAAPAADQPLQWGAPGTNPATAPSALGGQRPATQPVPEGPAPQSPMATAGRGGSGAAVAAARGSLFELADSTPITVDGTASTAGQFKRSLMARIAAKAGPPKTVRSTSRQFGGDLADAVATARPLVAGNAQTVHSGGLQGVVPKPDLAKWGHNASEMTANKATSQATSQAARLPGSSRLSASAKIGAGQTIADLTCADKGPPTINEVQGRLKPGGKATLWGRCFGDRTGRVEVIGQFPGGKLSVAFTAWDQNGIDLDVPATVRGAVDHSVAVTVVTADGKRSPAMQAKFVAAREQVEVPQRLWSPGASFELAATTDANALPFGGKPAANPAATGRLVRNLRINPQCALDTMSADVLAGGVTEIRGWDQGPPNEAAVTLDWVGTCIDTTTTVTTDYVVTQSRSVSVKTACRVALQPRAWAYCPVGIAP